MVEKQLECECGKIRKYRGKTENARKYAKKHGWKYTKFTGDKCPDCIKLELDEWKGIVGCVG